MPPPRSVVRESHRDAAVVHHSDSSFTRNSLVSTIITYSHSDRAFSSKQTTTSARSGTPHFIAASSNTSLRSAYSSSVRRIENDALVHQLLARLDAGSVNQPPAGAVPSHSKQPNNVRSRNVGVSEELPLVLDVDDFEPYLLGGRSSSPTREAVRLGIELGHLLGAETQTRARMQLPPRSPATFIRHQQDHAHLLLSAAQRVAVERSVVSPVTSREAAGTRSMPLNEQKKKVAPSFSAVLPSAATEFPDADDDDDDEFDRLLQSAATGSDPNASIREPSQSFQKLLCSSDASETPRATKDVPSSLCQSRILWKAGRPLQRPPPECRKDVGRISFPSAGPGDYDVRCLRR
jgi:hypothetical protein